MAVVVAAVVGGEGKVGVASVAVSDDGGRGQVASAAVV